MKMYKINMDTFEGTSIDYLFHTKKEALAFSSFYEYNLEDLCTEIIEIEVDYNKQLVVRIIADPGIPTYCIYANDLPVVAAIFAEYDAGFMVRPAHGVSKKFSLTSNFKLRIIKLCNLKLLKR